MKAFQRMILKGDIADPANPPSGCYFHPRCRYAEEICKHKEPPFINVMGNDRHPHYAACHFADKLRLLGIKSQD